MYAIRSYYGSLHAFIVNNAKVKATTPFPVNNTLNLILLRLMCVLTIAGIDILFEEPFPLMKFKTVDRKIGTISYNFV